MFLALLLGNQAIRAHDIITTKLTYTRDISRIFARRCVSCHSAQASLPLTAYDQVRPWAVDIKEQILSRQMPPWGAVKGFGDLSPDFGLTQEEVLIIASWVIGGAPQGNAALLPPEPIRQQSAPRVFLSDALVINSRCRLDKSLTVAGIRPVVRETVKSARIVAHFPDGHIEPLLWLFGYDAKWGETFHFRQPILLPTGTLVSSDSPLRFTLERKP